MDTKQERAFEQILHSIQQAQIPGNDWRRELKLIESTCRAALQPQPTNAEPIGYVEPLYVECRKRGLPLNSKVFARPTKEATKAVYSSTVTTMQSQDREDAALAETLREAAQIIAAIPPEHAPQNIRWPIVDELEGFALRIDHARRIEGDGK